MYLNRNDLQESERIHRLNLINSIPGLKPANLIGTQSQNGILNLAIFSSVIHLGSNPPLLGMVLRPTDKVSRDTYDNIQQIGYYTINQVHESFIDRAHYTSAKFPSDTSEFEKCNLAPEWIGEHKAPFVKESTIKIGMKWEQSVSIALNNTHMVIGSVEHLVVPDEAVNDDWQLDLEQAGSVGISGLNSYYHVSKAAQHPYARPDALPTSWDSDWQNS